MYKVIFDNEKLISNYFGISYAIPTQVDIDSNQNEAKSNNGTLIFAQVIFRHGERTTTGSMQLTNEGKRQQYNLGKYFHRRYNNLLDGKYSPDKVYILSTDSDRAIMSAQANLAGLFPPMTEEEKWNEEINWQPIPVHTVPKESDILLHGDKPCPKYDALYKYYTERSPVVQRIYKKYGHLFPYWSEMSGINITTIEDVFMVYKMYYSDKERNRPVPDWAEEAIRPNGPMEYITKVNYRLKGTPELARLKSGFLIKEMLEHFSKKMKSTLEPNRRLWLYSAHSTAITTMLNGLGFSELYIPPHACSLHFELFKTDDNKYYLQLFYRKPDDEYAAALNVPGCGTKWKLDKFHSVFKKLIPGDYDAECKLSD